MLKIGVEYRSLIQLNHDNTASLHTVDKSDYRFQNKQDIQEFITHSTESLFGKVGGAFVNFEITQYDSID